MSDIDNIKRKKCAMFIALRTALVNQTNTNGQIFRGKIPYLLAKLEVSVSRQHKISQYELSSLQLQLLRALNSRFVQSVSYFSNNLTEVEYMRSLK